MPYVRTWIAALCFFMVLAGCATSPGQMSAHFGNGTVIDAEIVWQYTGDIGKRPLVNASINGRNGLWLLDTGSTYFILHSEIVQQMALEKLGSIRVSSVAGEITATTHLLPAMQIGDLELQNIPVLAMDLTKKYPGFGTQLMGVLGSGLLRQTTVELDFPNNRLRFIKAGKVISNSHEDIVSWKQQIPMISFSLGTEEFSKAIFDTGNVGGLVVFPDGELHQQLLNNDQALPNGLAISGQELSTVVDARMFSASEVRLHNNTSIYRAPMVWLEPEKSGDKHPLGKWNASFGILLLQHCKWYFSTGDILGECPQSIMLPGGFGVLLKQNNGRIMIDQVFSDSPAEAAGIEPGDLLQAKDTSVNEFWKRNTAAPYLELEVEKKDGQIHNIRVQRKHFLPLIQ